MRYEKPELQILAAAVSAIQHPTQKGSGITQDGSNPATYVSFAAYDADE